MGQGASIRFLHVNVESVRCQDCGARARRGFCVRAQSMFCMGPAMISRRGYLNGAGPLTVLAAAECRILEVLGERAL